MIAREQGTIVAEYDEEGSFLVMTPDGAVCWRRSRRAVEVFARRWFAEHLEGADVGVGKVEYRGIPE